MFPRLQPVQRRLFFTDPDYHNGTVSNHPLAKNIDQARQESLAEAKEKLSKYELLEVIKQVDKTTKPTMSP